MVHNSSIIDRQRVLKVLSSQTRFPLVLNTFHGIRFHFMDLLLRWTSLLHYIQCVFDLKPVRLENVVHQINNKSFLFKGWQIILFLSVMIIVYDKFIDCGKVKCHLIFDECFKLVPLSIIRKSMGQDPNGQPCKFIHE